MIISLGTIRKPCGQRRGIPEKTMSIHKGEGVSEAGPRGQLFFTYYSTKCVILVSSFEQLYYQFLYYQICYKIALKFAKKSKEKK